MKNLLVGMGIAFLAVVNGATQCDNQKFQQCFGSFTKDLGMTGIPADFTDIGNAVLELLGKEGLEGQKKVCTAVKNLKTCLGDQYDSCMSKDYLVSIGQKADVASTFPTLIDSQNYICTTGWDVFSKNWDCINDVANKNAIYIAKCNSDYDEKKKKDPANACKYTQENADCNFGPFNKGCGSAVASTVCEARKFDYAIDVPGCSISCTGGPAPTTPHSGGSTQAKKGAICGITSLLYIIGIFILS